MDQVTLSKELIKTMAERLREFMREGGTEMKQTHAYEAVARMLGFRNWNVLSGSFSMGTAAQNKASPISDRVAIFWPWVSRAAGGKLHADGTPRHKVVTWQTPQKDKSTVLQFQFPTMMLEPDSFGLPVKRNPGDSDGPALLGIFVEAVACLLEVYARKDMDGIPESGHELSQNLWWATMHYSIPGADTFKLTVRARGGRDYAEGKARLTTAAADAIHDLRAWAAPLLDGFRSTGRQWTELEQHADWVAYVLRTARLAQPHLT